MIFKEVEVPARETVDFRQCVVHRLGVEPAATGKEGLLITEIADVRTTSRDHDGVWHQIEMALDQIAADRRQTDQSADSGIVAPRGRAGAVVTEESRPCVLSRTSEDRVCMVGGFFGERGDMEPAHNDEDAA